MPRRAVTSPRSSTRAPRRCSAPNEVKQRLVPAIAQLGTGQPSRERLQMNRPEDADAFDAQDEERKELAEELREGETPGTVGALDGAAAAGSQGAVGAPDDDSEMPTSAPDPSIGPD